MTQKQQSSMENRKRLANSFINTIKIEKNIPMPNFSRTKYPFDQMKVGDSFFASKPTLGSSIMSAEARTGFSFKSKFQDGGTRVWRVA
jgi:hypothetical protein